MTAPLTTERIEEMREYYGHDTVIALLGDRFVGSLIAKDFGELLDAYEALAAERDKLKEALRRIDRLANTHALRNTMAISNEARRALGEGNK